MMFLDSPFFWPLLIAGAVGYLAGSIPFGLILTRLAGAGDLRAIGSGNIGATNVLRTGRKGLALATLLLDLAKGFLPVALGHSYLGPDVAAVAGLGAVVGHCFPIWLLFKGGKGVATAAGVVLGLSGTAFVCALSTFIATVALTRYVSLGSILACAVAPLAAWLNNQIQAAEFLTVVAVIIVAKHHANIRRLAAGNENKLSLASKA